MKHTGEKIDYDVYHLSWKQWIQYITEAVVLCGTINYLFYQSAAVFLFILPVSAWYIRKRKRQQIQLRKRGFITSLRMLLVLCRLESQQGILWIMQ